MFDPFYAGVVTRNDVKHWKVAEKRDSGRHKKQRNQQKTVPKIYAVLIIQKKLHAVLLEPYVADEEIMIDRLKFLCGIQPRYMSQVNVCLSIVDGTEVAVNFPVSYNMIYAPFVVERMLIKIMKELLKQTQKYNNIELLAFFDNKKRTIGKKRQNMLQLAQGEYVVFIDDDDKIADDYIDEIMTYII